MAEGKCILVGAGDFTPVHIPVREGDYCIAVDGGFRYCSMLGILPDLLIGDFDSLDMASRHEVEEIEAEEPQRVVRLQPEKDDTDMLAALRIGLQKGYTRFQIYAGMGGRLEHTIANLQCLAWLKEQGATGYILDEKSLVTVIRNEDKVFHEKLEGYINIFSFSDISRGVTLENLKYELQDAELSSRYPIGISNEFVGKPARVSVQDGTLLIIVNWETMH